MRAQTPRAPEAITFERDYRGTIDQAQHVRADLAKVAADCPVSDDLVLLASELSTNAILHSRSGHPDVFAHDRPAGIIEGYDNA